MLFIMLFMSFSSKQVVFSHAISLKCFLFLSSWHQDSVDGIRLFSAATHIFGPRNIVREVFVENEERCCTSVSGDREGDLDSGVFMRVFKETFVPWCLHEHTYSTSARLDLLLTLFDNETFNEQNGAVLWCATDSKHSGPGPGTLDSDCILILAMLLEKARDLITLKKARKKSSHQQESLHDNWHHERLESTAVVIACSSPPFGASDSRFIR